MTTRVALLRGINVGGNTRLAMADLRELASKLGLADPRTYIQSGNLVFETELGERETVVTLSDGIAHHFHMQIPVIVRSGQEWDAVARHHPHEETGVGPSRLMVAFLDREPAGPVADSLDETEFAPDLFLQQGRELFLAYPNGLGRSRLSHSLLEKRLSVAVTIRNWRTVQKIAALVDTSGRS